MNNRKTSTEHEEYVAKLYNGKRSPSSGASVQDKYDVWTGDSFIECKSAGGPGKPKRSTIVKNMEKIADDAWAVGKTPALNYRFYNPDSVLAKRDGFVYLSIRLADDDAALERNQCSCNGECSCQ